MAKGVPGTARCGTQSGWSRHQKAGEKPCPACARAKARYDADRRQIPEVRLKDRLRAKAQNRAYSVLAHRYPDEYREEYLRQLALAFQEAYPEGEPESVS